MEHNKKMIAAVSAVMHYLKTEEEVACMMASAQPQVPKTETQPPVSVSLWALSGRQQQMQSHSMMLMKVFHR
jgi:TfoX/Sxy family transcriptional regulator of competence genes